MAIFWVPAVWKDADGDITHIVVKQQDGEGLNRGVKITVARAVGMIDVEQHELYTCQYGYSDQLWKIGAKIHVFERRYLRTNADAQLSDNLDNMIPMHYLGA